MKKCYLIRFLVFLIFFVLPGILGFMSSSAETSFRPFTIPGMDDSVNGLTAVNDMASTGPMQKVKVNVLLNDTIPCDDYTLQIVSVLDPVTEGIATVLPGGFIEFTPGINCINTIVNISYGISCSIGSVTAILAVTVTEYNLPANLIDETVSCYDVMPSDILFGIREKFKTEGGNPSSGYCIDGMSSPMVGDLNGDGKPEIVMMGVTNGFTAGAQVSYRYISIYNGQTGARMYRYDLGAAYGMGDEYHRAPSSLALADVDNDGIGEIVVATSNGLVRAYKPVFSGVDITGMNLMWTGNVGGTTVSYAAPLTASQSNFGYPHPYIADLNGDGIPEVIIYNKIFNAQTGALLMSWRNEAPVSSPKYSSIATGQNGLAVLSIGSTPATAANAATIKNAAMTGRRIGADVNGSYNDGFLAVPAIVDIDGDGQQEIITGNRIHKFQFNSLTDHTQNTYYTIEGPASVTLPVTTSGTTNTFYLSDGFTRVADIDGDGNLEIVVVTFANGGSLDVNIMVYVWDPQNPTTVKAANTFYADGEHGNFSIPFIGDINGKYDGWDGTAYARKLPEICILSGGMYINRVNANNGRSGIFFHPLSDEKLRQGTAGTSGIAAGWDNNQVSNTNRQFNRGPSGNFAGHIIGLTYDAQATAVEERLKVSWGMGHSDHSGNTGITLFDFDNNNTMDICYRDERTLRVISPAKGNNGAGSDFVTYDETESTAGNSIMFRTDVFSGTGFEYPTIADVNMDGSADILVTQNANSYSLVAASGYIRVFEYSGQKWAPCPPVWNQSMYDPTQIREDLKVNARPQSMLTPYTKNGETIYPFNGSWIQQPIVKANNDYVPVVRYPDAIIRNMVVSVQSTTATTITLTIFNQGTATIASSTPISFYNGGATGNSLDNSTFIGVQAVGIDIFPNEIATLSYTLSGNFNNSLIWARIMANNTEFPATGYEDCDLTNNTMEGIDCPYLTVKTTVYPGNVICGTNGAVKLSVTDMAGGAFTYNYTPQFQWYKNDVLIQGAADSVLFVSESGIYHCYVRDNICVKRTQAETITINYSNNPDDPVLTGTPASGYLCTPPEQVLITVSNASGYTSPAYYWYKGNDYLPSQTTATCTATTPGLYRSIIITEGCMVTDTFRVTQTTNTIPTVANITAPAAACSGNVLILTTPSVIPNGCPITAEGWQISTTVGGSTYTNFNPATAITTNDHGKYIRYSATNDCGTTHSNTVEVTIAAAPMIATIADPSPICPGGYLSLTAPTVTNNNSTVSTSGWQIETSLSSAVFATFNPSSTAITPSHNGLKIRYRAVNSCGESFSNEAAITVLTIPTIASITTPSAICAANALSVTKPSVTSNGGSTVTSESWQIETGVGTNIYTNITMPHTMSIYDNGKRIRYRATNSCGDAFSNAVTVTVNTIPTIASIATPADLCPGSALNITTPTITSNGGATIGSQSWQIEVTAGSGTYNNISMPYTVASTDNGKKVRYIAANICGTAHSNEITLTVNAVPGVNNISSPAAVCAGSTLTVYNPTVTNNGFIVTSASWQIETVIGSGTYTNIAIPYTVAAVDDGKRIRYRATNDCGDGFSNTVVITVNTIPTIATISTPSPVCASGSLSITNPVINSNGGSSVLSQSWQIETGVGTGTYTNITLPYTLAAADHNKKIRYRATNSCGDGFSNEVYISVTESPTAGVLSYNGGNAICIGSTAVSASWSTNPSASGTYTISPASGLNINSLNGTITPTIGTTTAGSYTITYTIPAAGGCPEVTRNTSVTIQTCTDLVLSVRDPNNMCLNTIDTITLTLINNASVSATNVKVETIIPTTNFVILSGSVASQGTFGGIDWNVGTLAAGASAWLKIPIQATTAGSGIVCRSFVSSSDGNNYTYATSPARTQNTISVNTIPTISALSAPSAICESNSFVMPEPTVTSTNAVVSANGWELETAVNSNVYTTVTLPYTVTTADNNKKIRYFATNACGTAYSNTVVVTVTTQPTAGTLSYNSGNIICTAYSSISPSWTVAPSGGTGTYTAAPSGLTIHSSTGIITPATSTPNNYTVTYTIPAAGGCIAVSRTAQLEVVVCTDLSMTTTVPSTICQHAIDTITVTLVNNAQVTATGVAVTEVLPTANVMLVNSLASVGSYSGNIWNVGSMLSGASATLKLVVQGTSPVASVINQAYVSAVNGDMYSSYPAATIKKENTFSVQSAPAIAVHADTNLCLGASVRLFTLTGTAPWLVTYYDGSSNQALTVYTSPYTFQPISSGTYTFSAIGVTASDNCTNTSTTTSVIRVGMPPAVGNITVDAVCSGNSLTSAGNTLDSPSSIPAVNANNSSIINMGWQIETAISSNTYQNFGDPFTVTFADNGKRIRFYATNACGTTYSNTLFLTVNDKPSIGTVTVPGMVCSGNNLSLSSPSLTNNGGSNPTTSWQIETAVNSGVYINFASPYTVTYSDNNKRIQYVANNSCGMTYSSAVQIQVADKPSLGGNIAALNAVCSGTNLTLTVPTIDNQGGLNATSGWQIESAVNSGVYVTFASPYTVASADNNKKIRFFATNDCGTVYSNAVTVTVTTMPVISSFNYAATPFCTDAAISTPALNGVNYSGGVFSSTSGLTLDPGTGAITPTTSLGGSYTVTYTIAAHGGCPAVTQTTPVVITSKPTISSFTYTGSPYCTSTTTSQYPSVVASKAGSYTSTTGLSISGSTGEILPSLSQIGTYTVTYTIPSNAGCAAVSSTTQVEIRNCSDLMLSKSANKSEICSGDVVTFTLTLHNAAQTAATNITVRDIFPSTHFSYVPTTPSQGTFNQASGEWTLTSLGQSAQATLTIVARAITTVTTSNIINQAYVTAVNADTYADYTSAPASMKAQVAVTINSLPDAGAITGNDAVCVSNTITLSNSVTGGQWKSANSTIATVNGSTGVVTGRAAGSGTIRYVVTNASGCKDSVSANITVFTGIATPTIASASGSYTLCGTGTSILLQVTNTSAYLNPAYQWYKDNNLLTGETGSILITTATGNYHVVVIDDGCSAQSTARTITGGTGTNYAAVDLRSNTGVMELCSGQSSLMLYVNNTTDYPGATYVWYKDNIEVQRGSTASYLVTATGDYFVHIIIGNCSVTSTLQGITQGTGAELATPLISSVSGSYELCGTGSSILLQLTNSSSYLNPTYQWYKNGIAINGATSQMLTVTESGNYTIAITDNGCMKQSAARTITGGGNSTSYPAVDLRSSTGSMTLCAQPGVLELYVNNTASYPGATYIWFKDNIEVQRGANPNYIVTNPGTYKVHIVMASCSVTSNDQLIDQGTQTGTPEPQIESATGSLVLCGTGSSILLTLQNASSYSGATFQWYKNGAALSGETGILLTVTATGNYYMIATQNGCAAISDTLTVTGGTGSTLPAVIVQSSTGSMVLCNASSALELYVANTFSFNNATYIWYRNGQEVQRGTTSSYLVTSAGDYLVHVYSGGCSATSPVQTVTQGTGTGITPVPAIASASGSTELCGTGSSILLTLTNLSGYGTGYSYQWYRNNLPVENATEPLFAATTEGTYRIVLTYSGCAISSNEVSVTVGGNSSQIPAVVLQSNTGSMSLCGTGSSLTLFVNNTTDYPGATYVWYKDNIEVQRGATASLSVTSGGTYLVHVYMSECAATSASATVTQNSGSGITTPTIASASGSYVLCGTESSILLQLTNASSYLNPAYQWYKDNNPITGETNSLYIAPEAGNYYLVVTDDNCSKMSATVTITDATSLGIAQPVVDRTPATNVLCGNGSVIMLSVTNTSDYSNQAMYAWYKNNVEVQRTTSPIYFASTVGNYFVHVIEQDNCSATSSEITITVGNSTITRALLRRNQLISNLCEAAGNLIISVRNANQYSNSAEFIWFNGFNEIQRGTATSYEVTSAGTYYVMVVDGNCASLSDSLSFTNHLMSFSITEMNEICLGTSVLQIPCVISDTISKAYTIQFSNEAFLVGFHNITTLTPLSGTTIPVTIPNNVPLGSYAGILHLVVDECERSFPFVIRVTNMPEIVQQPTSIGICNDDGFTLSVEATGVGVSYQWFKDDFAIAGATGKIYTVAQSDSTHYGSYYVIVSNACGSKISEKVTVGPSAITVMTKWNDVIFVSNSGHPYIAYQWYRDGLPIGLNGNHQYYSEDNALNGTYTVRVTYADGRTEMSCPYTAVDSSKKSTVLIYPNPAFPYSEVTVDLSGIVDYAKNANGSTIDFYDIEGRLIETHTMSSPKEQIHLNINLGVYLVRITTPTKQVFIEKIIILQPK